MTVTDDQIRQLIDASLRGRQNASKRTLRVDCAAALRGDEFCRAEVGRVWADEMAKMTPAPCCDDACVTIGNETFHVDGSRESVDQEHGE